MRRALLLPLLLAAALALSGCESSEDKAERYYRSGLEYLAAGDQDRALIEFRNVFKYNGFHKEARQAYADTLFGQGRVEEAYSQYLRLIEQYPDTPAVRRILAETAIGLGNWDEAARHGEAALKLDPQNPDAQAIKLALDYRAALVARDAGARDRVAAAAQALLGATNTPANTPAAKIARRIVIDQLLGGPTPAEALPVIEAGIATDPGSLELHMLKFRLLAEAGDIPATGAQLKRMFELFPENETVRNALIAWYLVQRDIDGAEAFLRQLAGDRTGDPEGHLAVVQLMRSARGIEAAMAELDALIAANAGTPNADLYGAMRASLSFEAGQPAEAIAAMEAVLKAAEPSDQTRRIKTMLARMLNATDNRVGARALVEEVLAEDASNVEALKQRAAWLIAEDKPGDAIADLRTALDQSPSDPEILTLMAVAHERDGNLDLAGERLAMAVEVSGSGAEESLRYAGLLTRQGRGQAAESVLTDALKVNPANPDLLQALAEFHLGAQNWSAAQRTVDQLAALKLPEVAARVQALQAAVLSAQNRTEDSLAFLQEQIAAGGETTAAVAIVVQTHLRSGKAAEARAYLDGVLEKTPADFDLRLLSGSVDAVLGQTDKAEAAFRALITERPDSEVPVRLLYSLLVSGGQAAEASAVLEAGIKALPKSTTLRWAKAGELERAGDIDGAIAIYEAVYAEDSTNVVIANNLASMITTYRDDPASLERAAAVARRLRDTDVPAFQDTYGWIEFRRGNPDEALKYLEPAAIGLPGDMMVQYHLGLVYEALGRRDDAIRQLELAVSIAGGVASPQLETVQTALQRLQAGGKAEGSGGG